MPEQWQFAAAIPAMRERLGSSDRVSEPWLGSAWLRAIDRLG